MAKERLLLKNPQDAAHPCGARSIRSTLEQDLGPWSRIWVHGAESGSMGGFSSAVQCSASSQRSSGLQCGVLATPLPLMWLLSAPVARTEEMPEIPSEDDVVMLSMWPLVTSSMNRWKDWVVLYTHDTATLVYANAKLFNKNNNFH